MTGVTVVRFGKISAAFLGITAAVMVIFFACKPG
jgi:hypothetical protein